jgi:hypothetical protein
VALQGQNALSEVRYGSLPGSSSCLYGSVYLSVGSNIFYNGLKALIFQEKIEKTCEYNKEF